MNPEQIFERANKVSANDPKRLELLWREAQDQAQLAEGDFIELGVFLGGSAVLLAEALKSARSQHRLHLLDSWEGLPKPTAEDEGSIAAEGAFANVSPEQVTALLEELKLSEPVTLHVGDFRKTLPKLPGPFALAHVDCDFYEAVRYCLKYLMPRMTPRGAIVVDDYGSPDSRRFPGVKKAIDECIARTGWQVEILGGEFDHSVKLTRSAPAASSRSRIADVWNKIASTFRRS